MYDEEIIPQVAADKMGYAIKSYYGRDFESTDERLNKLWEQDYDALKALRDYLPDSNY